MLLLKLKLGAITGDSLLPWHIIGAFRVTSLTHTHTHTVMSRGCLAALVDKAFVAGGLHVCAQLKTMGKPKLYKLPTMLVHISYHGAFITKHSAPTKFTMSLF